MLDFLLQSFANWLRYQISSYYFECKTNCNRKCPVESYKSCTFHGRATNILYVHSITQQFQRWRKYIHALSRDCRYMLWLLTPIQWHRGQPLVLFSRLLLLFYLMSRMCVPFGACLVCWFCTVLQTINILYNAQCALKIQLF